MNELLGAHLAVISLVWTGVFHTFGVVGYLAHSHRSVFHDEKWLSLSPATRPQSDGNEVDSPHRREESAPEVQYLQSRRGMVLDAEEAAWRMNYFAWLTLPTLFLVFAGFFAEGIGLLGLPLLYGAYLCAAQARRLSESDPAFLTHAPVLRGTLRVGGLFCLTMIGMLALARPESLAFMAPLALACWFGVDLSGRIDAAGTALKENFRVRGLPVPGEPEAQPSR